MKITPNFVVIQESYNANGKIDFSQCLGVFETYQEALGCAYLHITETAYDIIADSKERVIGLPESMEGNTGAVIHVSFGGGFEECICIFDNREEEKNEQDDNREEEKNEQN